MSTFVSSEMVVNAAVLAAQNYVGVFTDDDPDDGRHIVPGELRRYLARLRLLEGVPFSYLVPDAALLPLESIRFFYIDRAWTDALVQGVLSVGTITTTDRAQLEAVYPKIRDDVDEAERAIRRPEREPRLEGGGGTITGFLLRSKAVSGWPNLHVRGYLKDVLPDDALSTAAESHPSRLKVLRMERLAPAVLLVLFDGEPVVVHVEEPRQGIQFGVTLDENDPAKRRARVHVRDNLTGAKSPPIDELNDTNSVGVPFRTGAPGVLHLRELRDRLALLSPNSGGTLESNEFALQMLRFPYRQVFGDPANEDGERFYAIDRFVVTIPLLTWKETMTAAVNP